MKYVIPEAKHPGDVLCIMPLKLNTLEDGAVYLFLTVDVASTRIVLNNTERGEGIEFLLAQIRQVLESPLMQERNSRPFNIVLHQYESQVSEIEALLEPHGGSLVINEEYMAMVMNPVVDELSGFLSQQNHS